MSLFHTKKTISYSLPLSLLLHGGLLLLVGGAVIVQQNIPTRAPVGILEEYDYPSDNETIPDTMTEELPVAPDLDMPDVTSEPVEVFSPTVDGPLAMEVIASEVPSLASPFQVMPGSPGGTSTDARPGGGRTGATNPGAPAKGAVRVATIFGRQVTSSGFGVVFDVSFSTHGTIDKALQEIENGFPGAVVVLAPGCGMASNAKGKIVPGGEYLGDLKKYQYPGIRYYMGAFLPELLKTNKKFEELWKSGLRESRMHVLHLEKPRSPGPTLVNGTQLAFQFLEKQGVDTIWWMADFEDEVEARTANILAGQLKQSGIKVIQHDFNGGDELKVEAKKILAEETGGDLIIGMTGGK